MVSDDLRSTFSREVQRHRDARGQSLEGLAEASGVAVRTLYNIEHDSSSNPQLATVERIAEALEVPAGDLLGADSDPVPVRARPLLRAGVALDDDDLGIATTIAQRLAATSTITMQELSPDPDFAEWVRIFDPDVRRSIGTDALRTMFDAWRGDDDDPDRTGSSEISQESPNGNADSGIA